MPEVVVLPSARRHGVSDEDIEHALHNAIREFTGVGKWSLTMVIGPGQTGTLLEIGVDETPLTTVVVHAMRARPKYR